MDKLLTEAIEVVRKQDKCSALMLQRHFRITLMRAFRLLEELQGAGIVDLVKMPNGDYKVLDKDGD